MPVQAPTLLDELSDLLAERRKGVSTRGIRTDFKATGFPSGTPTTNYVHGPGGIFGVSGLEQDVFSTRINPRGLAGALQSMGSMRTNPLFPYLTGFLADTGTNPDGVCDDPQTAGMVKSCIQTAAFGRYTFQTQELELNRIGQQIDRGEFLDLRLVNDPLVNEIGGLLGGLPARGDPLGAAREVLMAWIELGVSFQNKLIRQVYIGNPTNNSANGGYAEFPGLDILIGTGKVDAITGTNCPSLDSDIKDFAYGNVDEGDPDIVEYVTYMFRYLRHNAEFMNLNPVEWAITMRPELFYELTAVWPCSYLTYRCTFRDPAGQQRVNVDAADAVNFRDNMRQGNYLLIDGMQVPVILDDGITEESNTNNGSIVSGCFASDIYFIPLSVRGGMASTYFEYLDYSRGAMIGVAEGRYSNEYWTDGGRFFWHRKPPVNWCVQWLAKIEPRVILRTPQLAGRIQNVQYCPLQHTRTPFPGDPYFVDGGVTSRSGPSLFSDWNLPG